MRLSWLRLKRKPQPDKRRANAARVREAYLMTRLFDSCTSFHFKFQRVSNSILKCRIFASLQGNDKPSVAFANATRNAYDEDKRSPRPALGARTVPNRRPPRTAFRPFEAKPELCVPSIPPGTVRLRLLALGRPLLSRGGLLPPPISREPSVGLFCSSPNSQVSCGRSAYAALCIMKH